MERGRWEGQNFQPLKEVQRLEEEEMVYHGVHMLDDILISSNGSQIIIVKTKGYVIN